jgi:hypothetical protein
MAREQPAWRAVAVVLAAFLAVAGSLALYARLAAGGAFLPVDFGAFYTGAVIVRDGFGARLYDLSVQAQYEVRLLGQLPLNGNVLPFVSPPQLALLLLPLSHLSLPHAFAVWTGLQALVLLWIGRSCVRAAPSRVEGLLTLGALAASPALFVTLYKGQLSLLLAAALLVWMRSLADGRDLRLAGSLVLLTIKPQLLLVPLILTMVLRRVRALALFAAACAVLAVWVAIVVGLDSPAGFLRVIRLMDELADYRLVYPAYMYNFRGLLAQVGTPARMLEPLVSLGLILSLVAAGALFLRSEVRTTVPPIRIALALLLGVFFCPHLYYYDALMLLPVALAFDAHLRQAAPTWRAPFLVLVYLTSPLFLESAILTIGPIGVRWPILLMMILMAVLGAQVVRTRGRTSLASVGNIAR